MKRLTMFTALLALASAAAGDEAAVRRLVQSRAGEQAKIEAIARVPGSSLYEITLRGPNGLQLFYVDDGALFGGDPAGRHTPHS